MAKNELLDTAIHKLALRPHELSIESIFELSVSSRAGISTLRACDGRASRCVEDVRRLRSAYAVRMEPFAVILCHDRDLACLLDIASGELIIEATNQGEEYRVVIVGGEFWRDGVLGQEGSARVRFSGLESGKTYTMALIILRSPDSVFEEAERIFESGGANMRVLPLLERAIALNPHLYQAWRRKAYILRELGRPDEALAAAEQSLLINPNYALGWRTKGAILRDRGKHQLGLDCYLRCLEIDPTDSICWVNKGNALSILGRDLEASEAYDEADRISALHPEKH